MLCSSPTLAKSLIQPLQDGGDDDGNQNMDDQEGHEDGDDHEEEPQTREDMKRLQARFKNNRRTAAHFYHQRYVQIEMRMVYLGAQPLYEEFQEALEQQKQGQVSWLLS